MKPPFLSVIIPTLNEEKYIEDTLKSIKHQSYPGEYEIIVADGMSKDKTLEIAKKYTDKIVKVKKKGPSAGRNAGAKIAKGEILVFVDADTVLMFDVLSKTAKAFRKKDVVGATCMIIPKSTKNSDLVLYWIVNRFYETRIKMKRAEIPGIFCAYRKTTFDKVGGFDEKIKVQEDFDLSKRICKHGKIKIAKNTFVVTSVRRIEKWGRVKTIERYMSLYLKYLITGKPANVDYYKPVR